MKKIVIIIMALMLAVSFAYADAKYIIKFASVAPEGSTWMNVMEDMNNEIMEKTKGEVKFQFYPGGVSGDEHDVLMKMKINEINAAGFTSQGLGEVVNEVRILNLPLIFKDYNDIDYIMKKMTPMLEQKFLQKGFVVLGWPEVGFVYVFSTKKIESIKDFRNLKMWIWGDDVLVNTLFKNLNLSPIPLSLIDVMQSLQTGLIEGVYCSPLSCLAMQWSTKVKYMLDLRIANVPGGVLINKQVWNKIPADYQKIIKDCANKYMDKLTQLSRKENEESLSALKEKDGIVFTHIASESDMKTFEDASIKTANELVGKFYTKQMLDDLLKYLAEAQENKAGGKKEKNLK